MQIIAFIKIAMAVLIFRSDFKLIAVFLNVYKQLKHGAQMELSLI